MPCPTVDRCQLAVHSSFSQRGKYTFPFNDIVEVFLVAELALDERQHQPLVIARQDQAVEGALIPLDLLYAVDEERGWRG